MNSDQILLTLGVTVGSFTVVKSFFALLGWYSRDHKDLLYRKKLDRLWEKLDSSTPYQFSHNFFELLVKRIENTVLKRKWRLLLFFFTLNLILFWVVAFPVDNSNLSGKYIGTHAFNPSEPTLYLGSSAFALVSMGLDYLSLLVTIWLLKQAKSSKSISGIMRHIVTDILIALFASFIIVLMASIIDGSVPGADEQKLLVFGLILGATSTLPSVAYLLILVVLLVLRSIPKGLRKIIQQIIFRLTTDKSPVMSQLGNIFGALVGIFGGILTVLKMFI